MLLNKYFYKVKCEKGRDGCSFRWGFGSYESKARVSKELADMGVFNILTAKQLIEQYSIEKVKKIVWNLLVEHPRMVEDLPDEMLSILI